MRAIMYVCNAILKLNAETVWLMLYIQYITYVVMCVIAYMPECVRMCFCVYVCVLFCSVLFRSALHRRETAFQAKNELASVILHESNEHDVILLIPQRFRIAEYVLKSQPMNECFEAAHYNDSSYHINNRIRTFTTLNEKKITNKKKRIKKFYSVITLTRALQATGSGSLLSSDFAWYNLKDSSYCKIETSISEGFFDTCKNK